MNMKLVSIESPFAGDVAANVRYARACMKDSLQRGEAPIASHLLYTQRGILNDSIDVERWQGIHAGFAWNKHAQLTAVYTDRGISSGMYYGIEEAQKAGRPVEYRSIFPKTPGIIGLSGKRGAGKNTVAELIQELLPHYTEHAFASKLKYFASQLAGSGYDYYSQTGKQEFMPEWGMSVGEFLQKLGTDAIRNGLHENAWVLALFAGLQEDEHALITDCRFPNELAAIQARGGIVVRVEGDPLKQRGDGTRDDNHPSECALDDAQFDYTIYNTGTLDELRQQVSELLTVLSSRPVVAPPILT